jgi:LAGLIDADG-like domain
MMTWAYITGFFDGEGSIATSRKAVGGRFRIQIVQSEKNGGELLLTEIRDFLLARGICSNIHHYHGHKCPMFVLYINQIRSTKNFLLQTFPYLRVKRAMAQDVIRYTTMFPSLKEVGIHTGFEISNAPKPWARVHMKGQCHSATKLNAEKAAEIRALKGCGRLQKDVAMQFGISRQMVTMIWLGKRWVQEVG